MNFNHFVFSSSSSSDDEFQQFFVSLDLEQRVITQQIFKNNEISQFYENVNPTHGGSVAGRRTIYRDREGEAARLFNDYFSKNPTFNDEHFRRRFRMCRTLFLYIVKAVKEHDNYFVQRRNAVGQLGLSTLHKVTAAFRMLAYGVPADATDEYIKIRESTTIECVKRFCRAVVEIFGEQYLRTPTPVDVARLLHIGSNNDINVLEKSHLFSNLARGITPPAYYVIQGKEYNMGYYLADGIYAKWSTLVQTIHEPNGRKKKYFAMKQESCRKDVERAFGVLQSRFAIVANPARFWSKNDLHDIMSACIIMHNMIIEDECDLDAPIEEAQEVASPDLEFVNNNEPDQFQNFLGRFRQIRDAEAHFALRNALIDHL